MSRFGCVWRMSGLRGGGTAEPAKFAGVNRDTREKPFAWFTWNAAHSTFSAFRTVHGTVGACASSGAPICNIVLQHSRATWSTPSEPPHKKPFFEVLSFSALFGTLADFVNLFILNLVCFISVCPCIPETGRLEDTYSCCGFRLWSWLAAVVVNLFVLNVVLHFRLPIPETGRL